MCVHLISILGVRIGHHIDRVDVAVSELLVLPQLGPCFFGADLSSAQSCVQTLDSGALLR